MVALSAASTGRATAANSHNCDSVGAHRAGCEAARSAGRVSTAATTSTASSAPDEQGAEAIPIEHSPPGIPRDQGEQVLLLLPADQHGSHAPVVEDPLPTLLTHRDS